MVQHVEPWRERWRKDHLLPVSEDEIASRVRCVGVCVSASSECVMFGARSELGYKFPLVMSRMIEANVQRRWLKLRAKG